MNKVHKDAIVHGHFYNRGHSNADLIHYADSVLGRNYRPTDEECKARRKEAGKPYKLSPEIAAELKQYAMENNLEYLLGFNATNADLDGRHSGPWYHFLSQSSLNFMRKNLPAAEWNYINSHRRNENLYK